MPEAACDSEVELVALVNLTDGAGGFHIDAVEEVSAARADTREDMALLIVVGGEGRIGDS